MNLEQLKKKNRERAGISHPLSSGGYTTTRLDVHTIDQITTTSYQAGIDEATKERDDYWYAIVEDLGKSIK